MLPDRHTPHKTGILATPNLMRHSRLWIARSFWTGAVLTLIVLLASAIALVLQAVGDRNGAIGVYGVLLVAASAWMVNFVVLVALLAWRAIHEANSDPDKTLPQ